MDELMARFVTNIERDECKARFQNSKALALQPDLSEVDSDKISQSIKNSMSALKDLLSNNTIEMERQPNCENNLYLKLMEKAQEQNKLKLINLLSSRLHHLIKTRKP